MKEGKEGEGKESDHVTGGKKKKKNP